MNLNVDIDEYVLTDSRFEDYCERDLRLQAFYEQSFRIPRYFKWTTEGGKL